MAKQTTNTAMGPIVDISIDSLAPFPINPFGLYTGQQLEDLVESIQANGVLVPIIVRPLEKGGYEILSGHNRVEASKLASLETVPAVVRDDLNDAESLLVLVETNLLQRSITDMHHSERAIALSIHYDAIKSQGRRTDLINEVQELLKDDAEGLFTTSGQVGQKLGSRKRVAFEQGLSERNVARYLRVSRLIKPHLDRLDSGAFALQTAVSLSYLSEAEQELVDEVLTTEHYRLSMADADALRHAKRPLTRKAVVQIVKDPGHDAAKTPPPLRLEQEFLSRYFKPEQDHDEIAAIIAKALDQYFNK